MLNSTYLSIVQLEWIALAIVKNTTLHRKGDILLGSLYHREVRVLQMDVISFLEVVEDRYIWNNGAGLRVLHVERPLLGIL